MKIFLCIFFLVFNFLFSFGQPDFSQNERCILFLEGQVISKSDLSEKNKSVLMDEIKSRTKSFKYRTENEFVIKSIHLAQDSVSGFYIFLLPQHHSKMPFFYFFLIKDEVFIVKSFNKEELLSVMKRCKEHSIAFNVADSQKFDSYFKP